MKTQKAKMMCDHPADKAHMKAMKNCEMMGKTGHIGKPISPKTMEVESPKDEKSKYEEMD